MFKNLNILPRLFILMGVMSVALLISTLIGWSGLRHVGRGMEDVFKGSVEEIAILNSLADLLEVDIVESIHKVRDGAMSWEQGHEILKNSLNKIDSIVDNYLNTLDELKGAKNEATLRNYANSLKRYEKEAKPVLETLLPIFRKQDKEGLIAFSSEELYPLVDPVTTEIHHLIDWHITDTKNDYQNALDALKTSKIWLVITFLLALAIATAISTWIALSITKPLNTAIHLVNRFASGDIETKIESATTDETGRLLDSIKKMADSNKKMIHSLAMISAGDLNTHVEPRSEQDALAHTLNDLITSSKNMAVIFAALTEGDLTVKVKPRSENDTLGMALVNMTKKLRQIIGNIQTDVTSLTSSSQEILASVSQVAASSSETAAAVTETTTTIEELRQTAQVSAEKAKDVLLSAEETSGVLKASEKSLQTTIEDMGQINQKMKTISEGIIKLSEHSLTIGEIIDSVNDLAEQSNLLAVNAAIEAAKAGEQGKGFGVVAQEIRTLAEQSKAATIQVKAILNDIQNATNAAVLATEQGSKAVDKGVTQSLQTNESMRVLSSSIVQVIQAANQISLSSQQQLIGVDQVTLAMNNINQATKQHVDNMKQIEEAVMGLNSIGSTLKEMTDQYNLEG